ncbi:MAG: hypothetical protein N3A58_07685 [Spirochaetes bacterium]|nr:hypothetical protein [Spirochaetota bacterium]
MKKRIAILFKLMLIFNIIFLFSFYSPFTKLKRIETENYYVFYPEKLSNLIDSDLLSFMEESYNKLSKLFKYKFKYKVNVYFSDSEKVANGFSSPIGRATIYIITTPPPITMSFGNMNEWLKYVFYHELTHQFSLALQNPFLEFLAGLFGNIFLMNGLNNPSFMIEGVTTSFERLDQEYGRVFEPEIRQYVMQDIIDKTIRDPYKLELTYNDVWPYYSLMYWYGGLFSYFLQQKYGMEKYINYWQNTLNINYEEAFKKVYEKTLLELWEEFYEEMKPKFEIKINTNDLMKFKNRNFINKGKLIKDGDSVYYYYYNINTRSIERINVKNKKIEIVIKNIMNFFNFEVSENNERIILSYVDYLFYNNIAIKHKIYDIKKRIYLKSELSKLITLNELNFYDDSYMSGYIGIDISRSFTDLIFIDKNGNRKVLLEGNKYFYISRPIQVDKNIYFLALYRGVKNLYSFNMKENKLTKIDTYAKNINNLNSFENKLFYSYNNDYTMNKFGFIDSANNIEVDYLINYSGGFFDPVIFDNIVYYIGRYSRFCRVQFLKLDEIKKDLNKKELVKIEFDLNKGKVLDYLEEEYRKIKKISNDKESQKESETNIVINNKDKLIKKSTNTIYPFEKFTLIPDLRLPYMMMSSINEDYYFGGLGIMFGWMHNITNSEFFINFAFNKIEDKFYPSISLFSLLNYVNPLTILIYFEYSHNINILDKIYNNVDNYNRLLNGEVQIGYYKYLSLPSKLNYLFLNSIFGYYKLWEYSNKEFNFDKSLFYFAGIFNYYHDLGIKTGVDILSIENNVYYSTYINAIGLNESNIKYENKISLNLSIFNIQFNNQFVISKNKNLKFIHKNDFYYLTILDNFYDLYYSQYIPQNINLMNYFETNLIILSGYVNNFLINLIGINNASVNAGLRYYLAGNTDIDIRNFINDYFVYGNLNLISYNVVNITFNISYSFKKQIWLFYFNFASQIF